MKKTVLIFYVVVLIICVWLLLHRRTREIANETSSTNSASQVQQNSIISNSVNSNSSATVPRLNASVPLTDVEKSNAYTQAVLAKWQGPINFYGKVIDENSNPVEDASIHFQWVEEPTEAGNRHADVLSDVEGLFSLTGQRGLDLGVFVGKQGYYSSRRDGNSFNYGPLRGPSFPADPLNPVIFHLKKKEQGVVLITSKHGMQLKVDVDVPRNNVPVWVDFFQKQAGATGQLEISQTKPPWQTATNWSYSLSIPDGGLIENQDEYQFVAPITGYQPMVEYDFSKEETNWTTQVTKQFYIAFGEPRKYGWLRVESNLAQETVFLTYAINPTGSQSLEPSQ
jgi:hypothetical protein